MRTIPACSAPALSKASSCARQKTGLLSGPPCQMPRSGSNRCHSPLHLIQAFVVPSCHCCASCGARPGHRFVTAFRAPERSMRPYAFFRSSCNNALPLPSAIQPRSVRARSSAPPGVRTESCLGSRWLRRPGARVSTSTAWASLVRASPRAIGLTLPAPRFRATTVALAHRVATSLGRPPAFHSLAHCVRLATPSGRSATSTRWLFLQPLGPGSAPRLRTLTFRRTSRMRTSGTCSRWSAASQHASRVSARSAWSAGTAASSRTFSTVSGPSGAFPSPVSTCTAAFRQPVCAFRAARSSASSRAARSPSSVGRPAARLRRSAAASASCRYSRSSSAQPPASARHARRRTSLTSEKLAPSWPAVLRPFPCAAAGLRKSSAGASHSNCMASRLGVSPCSLAFAAAATASLMRALKMSPTWAATARGHHITVGGAGVATACSNCSPRFCSGLRLAAEGGMCKPHAAGSVDWSRFAGGGPAAACFGHTLSRGTHPAQNTALQQVHLRSLAPRPLCLPQPRHVSPCTAHTECRV